MFHQKTLLQNFIYYCIIIILYLYFEKNKNELNENKQKALENSNEQKIIKNIYQKLVSSERRVYSKLNVDGVIETVFQLIKVKNLKKFYAEIGAGTGKNS